MEFVLIAKGLSQRERNFNRLKLEELGFTIMESDDWFHFKTLLPQGWEKLVVREDPMDWRYHKKDIYHVVDETGRVRVVETLFLKGRGLVGTLQFPECD